MAEIVPNQVSNDINNFKEEMLKKVRELENKLTSQIENKESALNNDYQKFVTKINLLLNNNKEMISTMVSQKLKLEKVSELDSFKNKVDSMLITHEIRIKNSLDEIEKMKTRYDKIISDNLYVAGFIGSSCQFRNLSEYINYNIAEVSRLKMEKEQLKKEIRELKAKWDGIMKSMITMNDNTVKLCNKYTDNKQGYFQTLLDNAKNELNQKSLDMRVMVQKFQSDEKQKMEEMKEAVNKLIKAENNLNNLINDNFYICEKQHEEIKNNISNELNKNKKILNNLDEKYDNLQTKLKVIENLETKITKLSEMVRSISSRSAFKKNNIDISKSVVQSPPKKLKRKGSNPDLIKLNDVNTENINTNINTNIKPYVPNKLQKSVRFPVVKKLNLNTIASSTDDLNKSKSKRKEDKSQEVKFNLVDDSTSINQEKIKKNLNDSIKEKEKQIEKVKEKEEEKEKIKEEENEKEKEKIKKEENIKDKIKEIDKEKEIDKNKDKDKEKEKVIERINTPKIKKANLTNTIQTLPILTIDGKRNSKPKILKQLESETSNSIDYYKNNNNILTVINNDTQTYSNLARMKKIGLDIGKENGGCKVVSLRLSPDSSKEGLPKGKRPPKVKYDIVNSLINDYRAKLFSKIHSPEQMEDMNNEILEMPKKVSQAFGRTTYTFYFNKDNFGKKANNILKIGLKNENENKSKK